MSHIVEIKTEVRDPTAIAAACRRLNLPKPFFGSVTLFTTNAEGWQVQLPRWQYPIVCDVKAGSIAYDNFEGRWGEPRELDRFLQGYAVEKVRIESARNGYFVQEQLCDDGSIRLSVLTGATS